MVSPESTSVIPQAIKRIDIVIKIGQKHAIANTFGYRASAEFHWRYRSITYRAIILIIAWLSGPNNTPNPPSSTVVSCRKYDVIITGNGGVISSFRFFSHKMIALPQSIYAWCRCLICTRCKRSVIYRIRSRGRGRTSRRRFNCRTCRWRNRSGTLRNRSYRRTCWRRNYSGTCWRNNSRRTCRWRSYSSRTLWGRSWNRRNWRGIIFSAGSKKKSRAN